MSSSYIVAVVNILQKNIWMLYSNVMVHCAYMICIIIILYACIIDICTPKPWILVWIGNHCNIDHKIKTEPLVL